MIFLATPVFAEPVFAEHRWAIARRTPATIFTVMTKKLAAG
jgi:hypothetical protein